VISFEASEVSIKQEPWGDVVILGADEDSDPDKYLALQKKDSYDEQDIRLGINDVHIEVCGQGWGWYGNIAGFDLTRDRIFVQLSSEAAADMEDDGKVEVTFSLDESTYASLRAVLHRVFKGRSFFRDGTTATKMSPT